MFTALSRALEARTAELRTDPSGVAPEEVLVLETVGGIRDFVSAVRPIAGLEWLGEIEERDIPASEDFGQQDETDSEKPLSGRIYLSLANQQALAQLLSLWGRWLRGEDLPRGFTQWRDMFQRVRELRRWDVRDRLGPAVMEDWRMRLAHGQEEVPCEIELWFRRDPVLQNRASQRVRRLVEAERGRVLQQAVIPQIAYSAVLARLPIRSVERMLTARDTQLVQCEQIRFFQPVGQLAGRLPRDGDTYSDRSPPETPSLRGEPVAALLDGLPLEGHARLAGRLWVDDPDGWAESYQAGDRVHGTAMASLILHGDLAAREVALTRPLYVRPILRADPLDFRTPRPETIPEQRLCVDLVHQAIRRMFVGPGAPVAPSVSVINFSIGDPSRTFDISLSPLAKLLDWLAWEHRLLILVSAGNYVEDLRLDVPVEVLRQRRQPDVQAAVIRAVSREGRNRRLLSPAEGINVITVGATHDDASRQAPVPQQSFDPFRDSALPSPLNAQGMGFRRSIKPELLFPGGRTVAREPIVGGAEGPTLEFPVSRSLPGHLVAVPGERPGERSRVAACRGTSNATALSTRAAVLLVDVLEQLRSEPGGELIDTVPRAVWLKAMLGHGADWRRAGEYLEGLLRTEANSDGFREYVTRFLGYGPVELGRVQACTDYRVTVLAGGRLNEDKAHRHTVPLPPSLSGKAIKRRLTVTLAWLSPINPFHQNWRVASLWFSPPPNGTAPHVSRTQADWQAVQRGTLQHEILEGQRASAYVDGAEMVVQVNCRADAGPLAGEVPYALVVTLEVAEETNVPIYDEVRARILPRIRVDDRAR